MKKHIIFLMVILCMNIHLLAQNNNLTKQEIYCNENIVWAGILYTDIVPEATIDKDWSEYTKETDDLDTLFLNSSRNLKQDAKQNETLQHLITKDINDLTFYETDKLESKQIKQSIEMEMYDENSLDDEAYGSKGRPYHASVFEAFRLKCFVYYLKKEKQFIIQPEAIALMRAEYDVPDEILDYRVIGWQPIEEWKDGMDISSQKTTWARRIYKNVKLDEIDVFKKEWNHEKVFVEMTKGIRENPDSYPVYSFEDKDATSKLPREEVETIATYEDVIMQDEDPYEFLQTIPYDGYEFSGLHFSMDWLWNDKNRLSIKQNTFGLLRIEWEETYEVPSLDGLFIMKVE